ncbi:MAG TPA: GTPase Era [Roseiflexaceae bacterium]|jgi:GTP-binding protein Era|nr:GTPase Era [Roseiflexaceae bacterium]
MITLSHDPEAGTLYWYFTEILAGSTMGEGEAPATLLLDGDGQIIGLEIELDESVTPDDLALALEHAEVTYNPSSMLLRALLADEEPAHIQPLDELAILDFNAADQLQGCEVQPATEFDLGARLRRIASFLVDVDEFDEDQETEAAEDAGDDEVSVLPPLPESAADTFTPSENFRSGFVAIIGRPNVGKSTLMNALLGQKIAIVSPKPQTTRLAIRGVLTRPDAQVVFVDTPGIHDPRTRLSSFMVEQARRTIPDADVICFVVDITVAPNRQDRRIAAMINKARASRILVLNKVDRQQRAGQSHLDAYRELGDWDMEVAISALRQKGLETLVDEIIERLPVGPPLYPADQVTDQNIRERAAELVREQVLRHTEQEVPHSVAVEVEEWRDEERATYIRMTIYVEKDSQKGILIGAGGAMLKQIGSAARQQIEALLGRTVFLDLWVKPRQNWRDDPSSLRWLGYSS